MVVSLGHGGVQALTSTNMASFAEYDEFGNYIGPDIDSDEDEDMEPVQQQAQQPLEGFEEEGEEEPVNEGALMQIGLLLVQLCDSPNI